MGSVERSETRYARSGDLSIAYQVAGEGPFDLVYVPGWVSNIELMWEEPSLARFLERLASFSRLILFDKRGTGLSDPVPPDGLPTLEELATVLFTDVVGSTETATRVGDRAWRTLLDHHHEVIRRELRRWRGREVDTAGDGFLATFDGPARAIRCAAAAIEGVRDLGLQIRAGLHTGEVEIAGDDVRGIAVHIGSRVSALAGPGEVLVSRTVADLVAGSGIVLAERGEHELKGVPGTWLVYAVESV